VESFKDLLANEDPETENDDLNEKLVAKNLILLLCGVVLCASVFLFTTGADSQKNALQSFQKTECTPIYSQCTCQTEYLSCADVNEIYTAISIFIDHKRDSIKKENPEAIYELGRILGGIVHLVWHDAVEYNPSTFNVDGLNSDGCVDKLTVDLEAAIELWDPIWLEWCSKISRADFWYLAAKVAIETSTPYVVQDSYSPAHDFAHDHYWIPFNYGRKDKLSCPLAPGTILPAAEGDASNIKTAIMNKFGLDSGHTVALIGAHTLGGASQKALGYDGIWTSRPDQFDNSYFQALYYGEYVRTTGVNPNTNAMISQWDAMNTTYSLGNYTSFMLSNPDLSLMFNVSNCLDGDLYCAKFNTLSRSNAIPPNACPFSPQNLFPDLNFDSWVRYFIEEDDLSPTESRNEPGASRWLTYFASAFSKISEVGYDRLVCANCPPPTCEKWACSDEMICTTGALDGMTDSSLASTVF